MWRPQEAARPRRQAAKSVARNFKSYDSEESDSEESEEMPSEESDSDDSNAGGKRKSKAARARKVRAPFEGKKSETIGRKTSEVN